MADLGQPAWRAGAVRRWLFARRAESFADMTDLPAGLRGQLAERFAIWTTTVAAHTRADDGTEKLLLQLADGQLNECVLLRERRLLNAQRAGRVSVTQTERCTAYIYFECIQSRKNRRGVLGRFQRVQ